jgi:class 3 adenylate cyclase
MFCDIRGFSRIGERLGTEQTAAWIKAVLDLLSDCVLGEMGVVVDYLWDGMLALWGAPAEQPDHAERACRAALTILSRLPILNSEWMPVIGEPMAIGIGLNTGQAMVGKLGSQYKFKYGAFGQAVKLGSRVEGVTKHFLCSLLITEATKAKLGATFRTRRLGSVQVGKIKKPVALYELISPDCPEWPDMRDEYEKALAYFENGEYAMVGRTLAPWRMLHPDDGPALMLLYRGVRAMIEGTPEGHPVWRLDRTILTG